MFDIVLIIFGSILLVIQSTLDMLSAIFLTGILLIIIGVYRISSIIILFLIPYWNNRFKIKDQTKIKHKASKPKTSRVSSYQIKRTFFCSICGEEYPDETIHKYCIACGSPLEHLN